MDLEKLTQRRTRSGFVIALALISLSIFFGHITDVVGQTWKPTRNIEFVTGTGAGSDLDRAARAIQKIGQDMGIFGASIVLNKPGANSAIAWGYVSDKKGQGEVVAISSPPLITNAMLGAGKLTHRDTTPLAKLYDVYMCVVVKADSPWKSTTDVLIAGRQKGKVSSALTGGTGSIPYILLAQLFSEGKVPADAIAIVNYKAAGDMMAALLGGHVDLVSSTVPNVISAIQNGQVRALAVASPRRLSGALANVPTLREQGFDIVSTNWRGLVGAPGLSKEQIAFWDSSVERIMKSDDWQKLALLFFWETDYLNSIDTRSFLSAQEKELGAIVQRLAIKEN